jgi:hypothetical protein
MFKTVQKTRKNRLSSPSTAATAFTASASPSVLENNLNSFFSAESANAFMKPWLRLERGLRLQRFRAFAEEYPGLSTEEKDVLNKVLVKANDAKLLNTKQQITYENGNIQTIRGLRMIRIGDSPATFKIDAYRATKKKVSKEEAAADAAAAAAAAAANVTADE